MKRTLFSVALLSAITLAITAIALTALRIRTSASVSPAARKPALSRFEAAMSVRSAGRGGPWINMRDGHRLMADVQGDARAVADLQNERTTSLSLASADFDEDGVPDLICTYTGQAGGLVTVHRGNADSIYPNSPEAAARKAEGTYTEAPFLSPAVVFATDVIPDFVGAGDFDADGHSDLVVAARGGTAIEVLAGDGKGRFREAKQIQLRGAVTAMAVGDVNRRDGLPDLAVCVNDASSSKLLVFESPEGALKARPESFALASSGVAIVIADLDGDHLTDIAAAGGNKLTTVRGRDRHLTASVPARTSPVVSQGSLPFRIKSMIAGDFTGAHRNDLAALTEDGAIRAITFSKKGRVQATRVLQRTSNAALGLTRARVSSLDADNIVAVESAEKQLRVITASNLPSADPKREVIFDVQSEPAAVLPMRLNGDALSDLVILEKGRTSPTIVVSSPSLTFTVLNTSPTGAGSLFEAIVQANASPGLDQIVFALGAGTPVINVGSGGTPPLPVITDAVTIDGTTGGSTRVGLNGSQLVLPGDGLTVTAPNCTIRGLVFSVFSQQGISLNGGGSGHIEGCLIGTDPGGNLPQGNNSGVLVASSANTIGGTLPSSRNVISGNQGIGVLLVGAAASQNNVVGNFIGTAGNGVLAIPNATAGVMMEGSTLNTVGGVAAGTRNLLSGNLGPGVRITGGANRNTVQGNLIGTNVFGTSPLPNADIGVDVDGTQNSIGGTTPAAANTISGNNGVGVFLSGITTTGNLVQGNFIGTGPGGIGAIGNSNGVEFANQASANAIGGAAAGSGNTIASNNGAGVAGQLFAGESNAVLSNSISLNSGPGIDLGNDGVTPNDDCDADTGPNGFQNFPVLNTATVDPTGLTIQGTLNSKPSAVYRIEFFSNPDCDASGNGEGRVFLGSTDVTTNSGCVVAGGFLLKLAAVVAPGTSVTATATDPANNTSEFSACVLVTGPACTLTCPPDVTAGTGAASTVCGTLVQFPTPDVAGGCLPVTCTPPSGAFFPVGTVQVTCAGTGGGLCSFNVTVVDESPPKITCPSNLTAVTSPGSATAAVNYALPATSDNCNLSTVSCVPPPGSLFPIGNSTVSCSAKDLGGNSASCAFVVSVTDDQAPIITCGDNVVVTPTPGQCPPLVSYPPPTIADNAPGVTVACVPPSGSGFPPGTSTVNCTATDSAGNRSRCSFTVTVTGPPSARVTITDGSNSVAFPSGSGRVDPRRKPPKKNNPCTFFTVQNAGFSQLVLTLDSIVRTGADVANGKITNTDDRRQFSVSLAGGAALDLGSTITIAPCSSQSFCVQFNSVIPALAKKNTALAASDTLPDTVNSSIVFRQNAGSALVIPIVARVGTGAVFINADNSKKPPFATLERSGNEFIITSSVFDSNLDVKSARYEFLTSQGTVVDQAFDVDLTSSLSSANLVRGQSFTIVQRFSGATSHPEIVSVRITIMDGDGSDAITTAQRSAASGQALQSLGRFVVIPPLRKLDSHRADKRR